MKTLIVGLGSHHGDDEIGWIVLEQLKKTIRDNHDIGFLTCDRTGLEWLTKLSCAQRLIFIDAMRSGDKPGTVKKIDLVSSEQLENKVKLSSHGINITQAVELARSLGDLPDNISFCGVEIEQYLGTDGLSDAVKYAIPRMIQIIKSEIQQPNTHY